MVCMMVVAWRRAAARFCSDVGCGHMQQLWSVQFAGVVFGALRGAELRPQPRQRPRGHLPAQQRGALAQARRSAPRQGTSCCLPASSPSYWQPRISFGSTRCWPCGLFFYKHLLVKGMKLLHHIPDTNLSAAETEAAPQAGSKYTGTAVRQEARWYRPSSVLRSELRTRPRTCIVPATHAACGAPPSGCCLAPGSE